MVGESYEVGALSLGLEVNKDLASLLVLLGLIHYSCGKIDVISKYRKLLPTAARTDHTREHLTSGYSDVAPSAIDLHQLSAHVEPSEYGPGGIVLMSVRTEPPYADQGATLVIHYQLVDRALEAIDLLLHSGYDLLDLVHSC